MLKFLKLTNQTLKKNGVKNHKELWNKVGKDYRGLSADVDIKFTQSKKNNKESNVFDVVMSTPKKNRNGYKIDQNFTLTNFNRNPVLLDSHNYSSITKILGRVLNAKVKNGNLVGKIEFMLGSELGRLARDMVAGKYLQAVSVGIEPLDFHEDGGIAKSDLLELSMVSIPADTKTMVENQPKKVKKAKKKVKKNKLEASIKESNRKRGELLKESLAVIQQLSQVKVDKKKRKQMANRVIKQMLKLK